MTGQFRIDNAAPELFAQLLRMATPPEPEEAAQWAGVAQRLQAMWLDYLAGQAAQIDRPPAHYTDPAWWAQRLAAFSKPEAQEQFGENGLALFETLLGSFGIGTKAAVDAGEASDSPGSDRRFADAQWQEQPFFALLHQSYLLLCDKLEASAQGIAGVDPATKEQLGFFVKLIADALSPSNFPLANPVVIEKAKQTRGESLVKGMEHLLADLRRGQLSHTDPAAFRLGENIATTPGKVVHETSLYQLIQYTPTTDKVLATPLVIFPPWINRFYILDLGPAKSFVRWAVEQGITVFMVSWKSADESMADVVWDDYIAAQIDAVDTIRTRIGVPWVHAIGYCVAGTTLAATLAVLARRGEADKIISATFLTAQVDFEESGDLKHFIDESQISVIRDLAPKGYLDGRHMAATFNLLRSNDLLWSYAVRHYLLGEAYRAFDLLHWNGDVTNLPARWHENYMRDLYLDNRLVKPDSLSALGTPIDLTRIVTPCYIQAGREDHIAPPQSVWKLIRHLKGPSTFVLAGSGHIAGVVNPPAANKYQYWINEAERGSLDSFIAGATEHPGSWWLHWADWLRAQYPQKVRATGKRRPGGKGDLVIEAAPGRYVKTR